MLDYMLEYMLYVSLLRQLVELIRRAPELEHVAAEVLPLDRPGLGPLGQREAAGLEDHGVGLCTLDTGLWILGSWLCTLGTGLWTLDTGTNWHRRGQVHHQKRVLLRLLP